MLRIFNTTLRFAFSNTVPIIDIQNFLTGQGNYSKDCETVAKSLRDFGVLVIKDPRVNAQQNDQFIDMMEKFFQKRAIDFYAKKPVSDIFPEHHFQVGATPEFTEKAKDHQSIISNLPKGSEAVTSSPTPHDAKWRYFWNIGEVMEDIPPNTPPTDFPEWQNTMNSWGNHMINGCNTVAEMAAIGLGQERDTFTKMMQRGPHKLAPTGSDLERYKVDTVFAGFHYDFNFLTIHGKSRYPGLFAWLRNGQRFRVAVPQGHLLLQAGKQFQILTGGYITCGYHQVIYTKEVEEIKNKRVSEGKIPWRISSTLFSHFRGDVTLEPLPKFKNAETQKLYPPISAQKHAQKELQDISLKK